MFDDSSSVPSDADLDSNAESAPPESDKSESEPFDAVQKLRQNLVLHLVTALDRATVRLTRACEGHPDFRDDADVKCTLALLHLAPLLLTTLKDIVEDEDPDFEDWPLPLIPKCDICGAGPGAHHPENCPQRKPMTLEP